MVHSSWLMAKIQIDFNSQWPGNVSAICQKQLSCYQL